MKKNQVPDRVTMLRCLVAVQDAASGAKLSPTVRRALARRPLSMLLWLALEEAQGKPAVNVTALKEALGISQAACSRGVASHAEDGTLETCTGAEDGRTTFVKLTRKGHMFVDALLKVMQDQCIRSDL